ncbi:hypothetical protein [Pseudanabaena sp. PCC 6802]|uniref:hypothetical protein n=1 Tax=Pseudanabaena sp. PCC 6802 TaxID=118173 RepID=UPI000349647E|nr:hypothetical protein [Pseudanabaena sp. PCC 6802]
MIKKDTLATFRIEEELWEKFKARAAVNRYSASALLLQYVEDFVDGRVSLPALDQNTIDLERRIDERLDNLEKRLDERIDIIRSDLEAELKEVCSPIARSSSQLERKPNKTDISSPARTIAPQSEPPIGTARLCANLDVSFKNLSTRAKRHDRTPEEQLIAEALEKGERWQVCNRNGRSLMWERVG